MSYSAVDCYVRVYVDDVIDGFEIGGFDEAFVHSWVCDSAVSSVVKLRN